MNLESLILIEIKNTNTNLSIYMFYLENVIYIYRSDSWKILYTTLGCMIIFIIIEQRVISQNNKRM